MTTQRNGDLIHSYGNELDVLAETIERRIAELEAQGTRDATYYYRDGRYLYINHHDEGRRKRSYVGTDPEKQAKAIAEIVRHRQRGELLRQLESLKAKRDELDYRLRWMKTEFAELVQQATKQLTEQRATSPAGDAVARQRDWLSHQVGQTTNL